MSSHDDQQCREQELLAALEEHRQAMLSGDPDAVERFLDEESPYFYIFREYFVSRASEGLNTYEYEVTETWVSDDDRYARVELDVVSGCTGFDPAEIHFTFSYRRQDDRWLLRNVREYRLHLIPGFDASTVDKRPLIVSGNSELSRQVSRYLAGHFGSQVVSCDDFCGSWGDVVVVSYQGDNRVVDLVDVSDPVTVKYGGSLCTRWAWVMAADNEEDLYRARDQVIEMVEGGVPPFVPEGSVDETVKTAFRERVPEGAGDDLEVWGEKWLEAARLASDPEPAEWYARAVLKWYRFVLQDGMLDSAIIVSNLMSQRMIDLAYTIRGVSREATFRNLARFVQTHLEHHQRGFTERGAPFGNDKFFPTNPSIGIDEMLAFYPELDKAYGMCGPLQYFNLAALRLCGFAHDQLVQIRILAGDLKHEVLCVDIDADTYLCTSIDFLPMKNNFYRFSRVCHLFTEQVYRGDRGVYTMSDARMTDTFERLVKVLSHNFVLKQELVDPPDRSLYHPEYVPDRLRTTVCDYAWHQRQQLTADIMQQVFSFSAECPPSHYTYAKYAYQTLYVHKPEAYAVASLMGPLARALAKEIADRDKVIAWIGDNIQDGNMFIEGHRIQWADQLLVHNYGTPRDKAMLAYALLTHLGYRCAIVLGNRGGYVVCFDDERPVIYDCGAKRKVAYLPEAPIIVFDQSSCWFPGMRRFDGDYEVLSLLGVDVRQDH